MSELQKLNLVLFYFIFFLIFILFYICFLSLDLGLGFSMMSHVTVILSHNHMS